jgi:hypothetical protein
MALTRQYARFVDSTTQLPQKGDQETSLTGMEYNDAERTQQWTGAGRQSVTLVLAEYKLNAHIDLSNLGDLDWGEIFNFEKNPLLSYDYEYKDKFNYTSKYIVVDQIDIKCTRKASSGTDAN